jgi:hypothetical protein
VFPEATSGLTFPYFAYPEATSVFPEATSGLTFLCFAYPEVTSVFPMPQYSSVKPEILGRDAVFAAGRKAYGIATLNAVASRREVQFRVSTGLKSVPKILN